MASSRVILFSALYRYSAIAIDGVDQTCYEEACVDEASFLQIKKHSLSVEDQSQGPFGKKHKHKKEIVFADLPMNFGEDIVKWVAFGADAPQVMFSHIELWAKNSSDDAELVANLTKMMKPGRPTWGPLNPKLQEVAALNTDLPGLNCPLFYTPQKYWPADVAEEYFGPAGSKEVFANLRDPFEMINAIFRMSHDVNLADPVFGVVRGFNFSYDDEHYSNEAKTCADPADGVYGDINTFVKQVIPNMSTFEVPHLPVMIGCYLQPQALFFDGPYGITHPLDVRKMPETATEYLEKHGYDVKPGIKPDDLMHIRSCDDTWAGDFDDEAKEIVRSYYKRDFELLCEHFGYCDDTENVCNMHIPGMCPSKLFTWDEKAGKYRRK